MCSKITKYCYDLIRKGTTMSRRKNENNELYMKKARGRTANEGCGNKEGRSIKEARSFASSSKDPHALREARILRERREALGLTQVQIAAEIGIELQQYQRYEYGHSRLANSTMKMGLRICAALELDPFEIIYKNGKDLAGVGVGTRVENSMGKGEK